MQFLYWLRAQWWKFSLWFRRDAGFVWLFLPIMLLVLVAGGYSINKELKTRAFVAEAQRVMLEIAEMPEIMNVKIKYTFYPKATDNRGHTCRIIDGWFTYIRLEDPKGFAHLSPLITDWTVCTPLGQVLPQQPLWDFHQHQPQQQSPAPEPHTFDSIDFRRFVQP